MRSQFNELVKVPFYEANYAALRVRAHLRYDSTKIKNHLQKAIKICAKFNAPLKKKKWHEHRKNIVDRDWYLFTNYSGLPGGPTQKELGDKVGITGSVVRDRIGKLQGLYLRTFPRNIRASQRWASQKDVFSLDNESASGVVWTPEMQYAEFAGLIE